MMRVLQAGRRRKVDFNMTPMIDVVFLLIIFFLVSSHLAQQENQVELALPFAAVEQEDDPASPTRVTIHLLADGRLLLTGDEVAPDELGKRLQVERQETTSDLEVRLRADRNIAFQYVEPVLRACTDANIWNVSFAVFPIP